MLKISRGETEDFQLLLTAYEITELVVLQKDGGTYHVTHNVNHVGPGSALLREFVRRRLRLWCPSRSPNGV